jgi:nucleotide sugar dehydrogenase
VLVEPRAWEKWNGVNERCCIIGCGVVGSTMLRADRAAIGIERDRARRAELAAAGHAVTDDLRAAEDASLVFVCLGTPCDPRGRVDRSTIEACLADLDELALRDDAIIVLRSTLPPRYVPTAMRRPVLVNPEFLRAHRPDEDFHAPPFVLVGARAEDRPHASRVFAWYDGVGTFPDQRLVSVETALLTKYAFNWWRCVKVEFANLLGDAAAAWGADIDGVMALFAAERDLNLSMAYLRPGAPFGGECLPKDLLAGARELGDAAALLDTVFERNHERGGPDPRRRLRVVAASGEPGA